MFPVDAKPHEELRQNSSFQRVQAPPLLDFMSRHSHFATHEPLQIVCPPPQQYTCCEPL
ncbi:hypothetical protein [Pyxidicoccus sp. MSG2]|uniref:hypothetical protein n=1 Tax=Pyxidicoccus sp. MSG2 TaxID=2996790 RepID=UPI00226E091D|nr:hypothetical protein [Pyxidicoccus sp. MSG2]MCY1020085.1 hypothetical protein [Pyxidicoccus sp. MSG2]